MGLGAKEERQTRLHAKRRLFRWHPYEIVQWVNAIGKEEEEEEKHESHPDHISGPTMRGEEDRADDGGGLEEARHTQVAIEFRLPHRDTHRLIRSDEGLGHAGKLYEKTDSEDEDGVTFTDSNESLSSSWVESVQHFIGLTQTRCAYEAVNEPVDKLEDRFRLLETHDRTVDEPLYEKEYSSQYMKCGCLKM